MDARADAAPVCSEGACITSHQSFKSHLGLCKHRTGQSKRGAQPSHHDYSIPHGYSSLFMTAMGWGKAHTRTSPWRIPAGACTRRQKVIPIKQKKPH